MRNSGSSGRANDRGERAVFVALMDARLTRALRGGELERRVLHPERPEDVLLQVRVELLPRGGLDDLADPVDVDAVLPALARIEEQRRGECGVRARRDPGRVRRRLICGDLRPPDLISEAGGVREQVPQRDGTLRRPHPRLPGGVETFQHLRLREAGRELAGRRVERELAALDQLHGGRGRDGLGHRRDPDDGVERHRRVLAQLAPAERAFVQHALVGGRHGDDPRHLLRLHGLTEHRIDGLQTRH